MNKLTRETAIEKFVAVHGEKYDYSAVVWKDRYQKLEITCPQHGSFYQNYNTHAGSKAGCPKCGLAKRAFNPFTSSEVAYLKKAYGSSTTKEQLMASLPGHTWISICSKANRLGLSSLRQHWREDKMSHLLEPTVLNAYLWGLLFADGYMSNKGSLSISLWQKDAAFLEELTSCFKMSSLKKANGDGSMMRIELYDKANATKLKSMLDYREQKTYNPPAHTNFLLNAKMRLAFFVGLSDGDGCLTFDHNRTFKHLRIVQHHNWYPFLLLLSKQIKEDTGLSFTVNNTNARSNASLYMGSKAQHAYIVSFIEFEQLPVLKRKWYNKGLGYNTVPHPNDRTNLMTIQ